MAFAPGSELLVARLAFGVAFAIVWSVALVWLPRGPGAARGVIAPPGSAGCSARPWRGYRPAWGW
jgi:hypothetical protein